MNERRNSLINLRIREAPVKAKDECKLKDHLKKKKNKEKKNENEENKLCWPKRSSNIS